MEGEKDKEEVQQENKQQEDKQQVSGGGEASVAGAAETMSRRRKWSRKWRRSSRSSSRKDEQQDCHSCTGSNGLPCSRRNHYIPLHDARGSQSGSRNCCSAHRLDIRCQMLRSGSNSPNGLRKAQYTRPPGYNWVACSRHAELQSGNTITRHRATC